MFICMGGRTKWQFCYVTQFLQARVCGTWVVLFVPKGGGEQKYKGGLWRGEVLVVLLLEVDDWQRLMFMVVVDEAWGGFVGILLGIVAEMFSIFSSFFVGSFACLSDTHTQKINSRD